MFVKWNASTTNTDFRLIVVAIASKIPLQLIGKCFILLSLEEHLQCRFHPMEPIWNTIKQNVSNGLIYNDGFVLANRVKKYLASLMWRDDLFRRLASEFTVKPRCEINWNKLAVNKNAAQELLIFFYYFFVKGGFKAWWNRKGRLVWLYLGWIEKKIVFVLWNLSFWFENI